MGQMNTQSDPICSAQHKCLDDVTLDKYIVIGKFRSGNSSHKALLSKKTGTVREQYFTI